ncbi:MAG: hypothetical protein CMG39_06510 [Candidatus Marinimicrobia bacterium]|nr:hypothetical protein [Candidatus Neomarinimicrobiota bacterium]|tara:strand:+ start:40 stop:672 length:633 start_codon:yes stop_codon:yes gene_type:complete
MSDILRQVDEDLRNERISNLWKKYGLYLISFIIIIVVLIIGFQLKISFDKSGNEKLVEIYLKAANGENKNQQLLLLEELNDSENVLLSGFADLKIANLQIEVGNIEEGILILKKTINDTRNELIIRDLALYFLLMTKINEYSEDDFRKYLDNKKMQNSKFFHLFKELISIKLLLDGKTEKSKKEFQELIDLPDTPAEIKLRARKFLEIAR